MTIHYSNGYTVEAVLLSHAQDTMRVEVRGGCDVVELRKINGRWISENCEPVDIQFASAQQKDLPIVSVNDCICPPEIAAKLLHMLFSGEEDAVAIAAMNRTGAVNAGPVYQRLV